MTLTWLALGGTSGRATHSSTGISGRIAGISNIVRVSILREHWLICLEATSGITVRITGGRTSGWARWWGRRWRGEGSLVVHQLGEHGWTVVRSPWGTTASFAR